MIVVEDEDVIRRGICRCLDWANLGVEIVAEAANGPDALHKIYRYNPDLVLMDIVIPGFDGFELVRKINEEAEINIPGLIIMSAYEDFRYLRSAIQLHALDYLLKPFDSIELQEVVQRFVYEHQSGSHLSWKPERTAVAPNTSAEQPKRDGQFRDDRARESLFKLEFISPSKAVVRRILAIIDLHYSEELTVKKVADEVFLSPNYMAAIFKKEVGRTFNDYITYYRLKKAKEMLSDSRMTVGQIGEFVGYRDTAYFSKIFKKSFGTTPKMYRERVL